MITKGYLSKPFGMRHTIFLAGAVLLFYTAVGQQNYKEYFLQRSKNQKATAWILLGAGAGAIITGAIIDNANKDGNQSFTGGYLEIGGIVSCVASIPFFIDASKNKKRAAGLSFRQRKIVLPQKNSFASQKYFDVSLLISLHY